ncbi:peptidoglycan-binding protein [Streptomyces sp. SAJ15]|uniref:peptidoglycan-binding domain-containing protein n=1 Tax=Streptomyces sp. SAJ15 TaxID=2011095 RepID=UPI0011865586|nr:peptidoglycan-binding domain-containing protein [Streptomyces sp. SAJ15]
MNRRKHLVLAASVVAFGGLALAGPSTGAFAASAEKGHATVAPQDVEAKAACPKGGDYKWKKLEGGKWGWTANYSNTMSAVIGKGDSGRHVTEAQCMLKGWGYNPGAIDGKFGTRTANAVKKFQGAHNIKKDGVVGKKTWKYLRSG